MIKDKEPNNGSAKLLSGIDTLYFFVKVNYEDYSKFYNNILLKGILENDNYITMKSLDYNNQFTFYEYNYDYMDFEDNGESGAIDGYLSNAFRIGFKNLNKKDNNHSIKIQMDSKWMQYAGYQLSYDYVLDYIRGIGLNPISTHINRADLNTYVSGYDFSYINYDWFSTRMARTGSLSSIEKFGKLETFYLGKRGGSGALLRIYDKGVELGRKRDDNSFLKRGIIVERYFNKFGVLPDFKNLWNVEIELNRECLRSYDIDTVEDLFNSVDSLHKLICSKSFRLLERTKDPVNNSQILTAPIWNQIVEEYKVFIKESKPIERLKRRPYKRDTQWLLNRINEYLEEPSNFDNGVNEQIVDLKNILSSTI